jgi:predicted phage tail protein
MLDYQIQGGKGGGEKPHTPVETPNNLLSVAHAKVLIAVAEGELAGQPTNQDIFLDGTPLANADGSLNFGGVKWEWRPGTTDQTYIQGLPEVSTEFNVGIELKYGTPWVRNVTKTQLDAVRITFQWPALLIQKQNGDTVGNTMDYSVEISTDGGPFIEYQRYNINGKTNTAYERTHRIDLPAASVGWNIRANKLTPDSQAGNVQDTINVKSVAEVVDAKQRYPNTALLYVEFDSRMFGQGAIPKVSVRTKGRIIRVPNNYDPETRTYSGIWSGAFKWAWSDNPAWVFHDIITNDRFGLGNKVNLNMVDKWSLYEIAQYCDVLVDNGQGNGLTEPRHTCNMYVQSKMDAWQVLRDMASIFNGMTYWNGNQFTAIADKREPFNNAPVFSRSNVINGRFDYQAADDKSIYTSALVSYDDPDNHYGTEVESTFETSQILRWGGDRQTEISAIGCTSRGEAQRRGKYTLITNMFNRTVSFRTGLQGLNDEVMPGKLIHVVDPLIGGRPFTGRIKIAVGRVLTLDRNVEASSGDIMYITRANGLTEGRTIESVAGNIVTLQVAYTELPQPNAVWYLEAADLKSQLFRVTKITSPDENVYEISAVEYNDSKYAAIDNGARLEPRPISVVPPNIQQPPTNIVVSAQTYIEQTMAITTMTASWDQTPDAVGYEVQWKVGDGDWVNLGVTGAPEVSVKGIYTGQYVVRVRAMNAYGIKSIWASSAITQLNGKAGSPPAVTAINATGMIFGIRLDWYFPPGAEDTLRTEFMYSETENFENAIYLGDFAYPISSHEMHGLSAGKRFWFWCRLHDRTGNIGPWFPASDMIGVEGQSLINDNGQYNDYFAGMISETALDKVLYDRIELIDGDGPGSVNERLETAVADLEDQIQNITDALVYDPTKTYVVGDIVRLGNKLYQAQEAVPTETPPPNVAYWKDVGIIIEEANATASQVAINTVNIEVIDGKLTSTVSQIESLQATYRDDDGVGDQDDAIAGFNSRAQINEERVVRASADEAFASQLIVIKSEIDDNTAQISTLEETTATADSALSVRIDSLTATVNTGDATLNAAITSEQTARVTADTALGTRIDTVTASLATTTTTLNASITSEQTARVNADNALGTRVDTVTANLNTNTSTLNAAIQSEQTARVNADGALGTRIDTVQATAGSNTAAIQQVSTAQATTDGKVNTAWTLKMEAQSNGQYVAAGIGLGIENGPAGLQSQFLVRADRFAVVSGLNGTTAAPFVVQGGQVFISQALIGTAWITNAMIGDTIQSNNYVANWTGWRLNKAGTLEFNGNIGGQGRLTINNNVINVFDANGVLRVRMGMW